MVLFMRIAIFKSNFLLESKFAVSYEGSHGKEMVKGSREDDHISIPISLDLSDG